MPMSIDMGLEDLKKYKPVLTKQADFEEFWAKTLSEAKSKPVTFKMEQIPYPVKNIKVFDISFSGYGEQMVRAWYIVPDFACVEKKAPALLHFSGYTWGRGYISQYIMWALQGYAVLAVDNRGQGCLTPDNTVYSSGSLPGWLTKGILDKNEFYYKRVYVDGVRALDFLESRPEIDMSRTGIMGGSQGGGIATAVAGLDSRLSYAMIWFPFLSNFRRAFDIASTSPYMELVEYFKMYDPEMKTSEQIFGTLSYFDAMNHAAQIKCPVLMAITLCDAICPPSTVFSVYNHIDSEKECVVFPLHGHETLFTFNERMISFAAESTTVQT